MGNYIWPLTVNKDDDDGPPPEKKRKRSDSTQSGGHNAQIYSEKDDEITHLKAKIRRLEKPSVSREEYDKMKQRYQTEKIAKDEALRRLSTVASSKLRDNNPNITDLSDPNRPTKIGEKLSELYDNQWTDAFDVLANNMKEENVIKVLRDILMKSYNECKAIATDHYFEKVQRCIEFPLQDKLNVPLRSTSVLPDSLKHYIKEFRKFRAEHVIKDVEKAIKHKLQIPGENHEAIRKYISGCVEVTWLMVVQDPPLVLSDSSSSKFESNIFKEYTSRGPYVDYVVWPALCLCEGGALLSKGVAQGSAYPRYRH